MSNPPVLRTLDTITQGMAHALTDMLPHVQLPGYLRFLDMMFHYTRDSGARLEEAAASAEDPELASFFAELARGEANHHRLAQSDLEGFDRSPSADPPAPVRAFQAFWAAPVLDREVVRLGALCALEGVATHLGDHVRPALARLGLGPSNARFVLVHLQADEEHGAACRAQAQRLAEVAPESVLAGVRAAAPLWVAMHRCLVED